MQGDGGRKFKVGTGREKEKERGRERNSPGFWRRGWVVGCI